MSAELRGLEEGLEGSQGEERDVPEKETLLEKQKDMDSSEDSDTPTDGSSGRSDSKTSNDEYGTPSADTPYETPRRSPDDVVNKEKMKPLDSDLVAFDEDLSEVGNDLDEPCSSNSLKENEAKGSPSRKVRRQSSKDAGSGDEEEELLPKHEAKGDIYEIDEVVGQQEMVLQDAKEKRQTPTKRAIAFTHSTDVKEEEQKRKREAKERANAEQLKAEQDKHEEYQKLSLPGKVRYNIVGVKNKFMDLPPGGKAGTVVAGVSVVAVIYGLINYRHSLSEIISRANYMSPAEHDRLFGPDIRM